MGGLVKVDTRLDALYNHRAYCLEEKSEARP